MSAVSPTYAVHPLALRIPAMADDQFAELRDDIASHGLNEPIVLFEGMVLDGRHRLRACEESGVPPWFTEFEGDNPVEFVLSANVKRRHLTPSQRAAIAVEFLPKLEDEARARMASAGASAAPGRPAERCDPGITPNGHKAREDAGALVGVSGASVDRAKRVQREDPEMFEQIKAGETTVRQADNEIRERNAAAARTPAPLLPSNPTQRQTEQSDANLRRLRSALYSLDGLTLGFEQVRTAKFALTVTPEDIAEFERTITESISRLRTLRSALKEHHA